MKRFAVVIATTGVIFGAALGSAIALPQYSQKEKTACTTCHVKPSGGMPLNDTGKYYMSHNHSLKGMNQGKGSKAPSQKPAKKG